MPQLPFTPTPPDEVPRADAILGSWIPSGSDVAIVDVPIHRNVGDLFILAVTEWWLESRGCRVVARSSVRDYAGPRQMALPARTILVGLGGGNFGDLYPRYQQLREHVAADFPNHRFVILPQSVHFTSSANRHQASHRLRQHGDLRLAVRDARSLAVAHEITDHAELMPDVVDLWGRACLDSQTGVASSTPNPAPLPLDAAGTLRLMRADAERTGNPGPTAAPEVDWTDITPALGRALVVMAAGVHLLPRVARARRYADWSAHATVALVRAVSCLATARLVITDRLHGAIAARLASRPVQLLDNSYGKLSAYYDAWWRSDSSMTLRRPA